MTHRHPSIQRGFFVLVLLAAVAGGCANDPFDPDSLSNEPPVAKVFVTDEDSIAATSYNRARFAWSGTDSDGFIMGFHVGIAVNEPRPSVWIFTTNDDTVATWTTAADGTVKPRLFVVAEDNRGALSDTVSTAFPLINTAPTLEFQEDFEPATESFSAIDFDLFGFDPDGDETLLEYIEYRYEGSDPDLSYELDDSLADATLGWVKAARPRRGFRLRLRDVAAGDPGANFDQTVYIRLSDNAGASSTLAYTWVATEVRGSVLLIDDNNVATRDQFYIDAMNAHFGDAWNLLSAESLPVDPAVLALTFEPFATLIWYVQPVRSSPTLERVETLVMEFMSTDRDLVTPGDQFGQLFLDYQYVGVSSKDNLSPDFRTTFLHVNTAPTIRPELGRVSDSRINQILGGTLEVFASQTGQPLLIHDPTRDVGSYFDLWAISPGLGAAEVYRFESAPWTYLDRNGTCSVACEPTVASRWPATGDAQSIVVSFQMDYTNTGNNAQAGLIALWRDQMGLAGLNRGSGQ